MMKGLKIYLLIILFVFLAKQTYAGFPVGKGRWVYSFAYNYAYSGSSFDSNWHNHPYKSGTYFSSQTYSLYITHGISRKVDVFALIPYVTEVAKYDSITLTRSDFADALLGLTYSRINKTFNKTYSFKLAGIFPLYSGTNPLPMGYGSNGIDFTFNYTNSPKRLRNKGYYLLSTSLRHYFADDGPNQLLLTIERYYAINKFNYFIWALNGAFSTSINTNTQLAHISNKDFDFIQGKLSYGRRVRRNLTLFLEGYYTPFGRNTGLSYGGVLMAILRVP